VFVVADGIVSRRPVTTGAGEGTLVEITHGLTGDELVIIEGKELTREGLRVRAELKK
jgi:multidrug efflux pump subunit AcrA (membrane-fusion protein)